MGSDRLIARQRLKKLGAKLIASPFFAAFAATRYAETVIPPSPWAWAGVFVLAGALYALGHTLLDSLNRQMEKLDAEQTTLDSYDT